jgi:hypothetical protein
VSLSEEVAELRRLLPELRALQGGSANASAANIVFNAGGWAALLAGAVAVACLVLQIQSQFQQQKTDTEQDADIREQRAQQRRADDYQNMLWRAYPELREAALKAHEERQNGKPDHH